MFGLVFDFDYFVVLLYECLCECEVEVVVVFVFGYEWVEDLVVDFFWNVGFVVDYV